MIITSLPNLKYKKVLWNLNKRTHQVWNNSKQTKIEEDIDLELERGLELFVQSFWNKLHSSFSYVFCVTPLFLILKECLKSSSLQSNDTKILRNEKNIGICSMIGMCLMMGDSTLAFFEALF